MGLFDNPLQSFMNPFAQWQNEANSIGTMVGGQGAGIGGLTGNNAGLATQFPFANLQTPITGQNVTDSLTGSQDALKQQQAFLQAMQAQNGIGNQTAVFNQLQNVANGQGPNPAQAMLNNATGTNVANQASLMAGQRGANANPALMARQIAQQGANTQQQAAGQGASLQAQQSLGALGQMGALANQQATQAQAAQNAYTGAQQAQFSNLANANQGQNQSNVAMQSNINSANAGLANTAANQQGAMTGNLFGAVGAGLNAMFAGGGQVGSNPTPMYADGGTPGLIPAAQAFVDSGTKLPSSQGPQSKVGQMFHSAVKDLADTPMSQYGADQSGAKAIQQGGQQLNGGIGKMVNNLMSSGASGLTADQLPVIGDFGFEGGTSMAGGFGDALSGLAPSIGAGAEAIGSAETAESVAELGGLAAEAMAAKGGAVSALVSPGERYLNPKEVSKVVQGKKSPMKAGEKIPGKPQVGGAKNSYANDTVPKTLQTGGIVLPRSVTQGKDAEAKAHAFVSAILAKQRRSLPNKA